ncbi:unnamed protein product [[Candida] boidinii]|nr:unnamed protein product [[Candida] boidinii]
MVQIYLTTISGLKDISLSVDPATTTRQLNDSIHSRLPQTVSRRCVITTVDGVPIVDRPTVGHLLHLVPDDCGSGRNSMEYVDLQMRIPMCGGKGGLGNGLRTQGGKMRQGKRATDRRGVGSGASAGAGAGDTGAGMAAVLEDRDSANLKTLSGIRLKTLKHIHQMEGAMKHAERAKTAGSPGTGGTAGTEKLQERIRVKREKLEKLLQADPKTAVRSQGRFNNDDFSQELETATADLKEAMDEPLPESESMSDSDTEDAVVAAPPVTDPVDEKHGKFSGGFSPSDGDSPDGDSPDANTPRPPRAASSKLTRFFNRR